MKTILIYTGVFTAFRNDLRPHYTTEVKTISDRLYTPLWCDPVPLTYTHTTRNAQNSAFEQSIANTWTNNKTYLQSLIQKRQIIIAKSELTLFFLEIAFVHSQPCTLLQPQIRKSWDSMENANKKRK